MHTSANAFTPLTIIAIDLQAAGGHVAITMDANKKFIVTVMF
jgi:hypothetical protein